MDKLRIMSVFGTRPEVSKCARWSKSWLPGRRSSLCCVTAQHRQMLDSSVLEVLTSNRIGWIL